MIGLRFETGRVVTDWEGFIQASVRHYQQRFKKSPTVLHCNPSAWATVYLALTNLGLTSIEIIGDFDNPYNAIALEQGRNNEQRSSN